MADKRNPTNADIIRKLDHMNTRIDALETWKITSDAAREAIAEYKRSEIHSSVRKSDSRVNAELVKNIGIALTIILALITAILAGKGRGL